MAAVVQPTSRARQSTLGVLALVLVLSAILAPIVLGAERRVECLWLALGLIALAFAVCGLAIGLGPWGIFIDSRRRVSLSRVQAALWAVILFGGLIAAVMTNVAGGDRDAINVTIPQGLLILAGISITSMVGSPVIKSSQREKQDPNATTAAAVEALRVGRNPAKVAVAGRLAVNTDVRDANWTDLVKGEQADNFATVDIGKAQMLLVTLLTAAAYVAALVQLFRDPDVAFIGKLPDLTDGMNALLAISHTGYLANKGLGHGGPTGSTATPTTSQSIGSEPRGDTP